MSGWELNEVWMEILARRARTPRNWKQMAHAARHNCLPFACSLPAFGLASVFSTFS
jgi:hypothetical protein